MPRLNLVPILILCGTACVPAASCLAAEGPPAAATVAATKSPRPDSAAIKEASNIMDEVRGLTARGQLLLQASDTGAIEALRQAAMKTIPALKLVWGQDVMSGRLQGIELETTLRMIALEASQTHYLWGVAAERFGHRDEAITALARAARFLPPEPSGKPDRTVPHAHNGSSREINTAMNALLRDGLPVLASDDVLDTVASEFYGGLWQPRRFSMNASGPNARQPSVDGVALNHEFLITSGRLFPPIEGGTETQKSTSLIRIPPLYRSVSAAALPAVLRLDKMIVGYERDREGSNKGLWRQAVRVFYPSSTLTAERRDDRPRAEALAAQFLKVQALARTRLGVTNLYDRDGVTTLWLAEVSALWPKDDENPAIRTQVGVLMPGVNTPLNATAPPQEIAASPLEQPWRAAGQVEWALGDIMFFRTGHQRPESEWLRELIHEYGHVALPAFEGYQPPLEPYGNGFIGETIGMVWVAGLLDQFSNPLRENSAAPAGADTQQEEFAAEVNGHVLSHAIPALRLWNRQGPGSALRADRTATGSQYVQGLALYAERVYGPRLLGVALKPLLERSVIPTNSDTRLEPVFTDSLVETLEATLQNPFLPNQNSAPVWLGGAFESPAHPLSALDFAQRAPVKLRAGERVSGWLYLPPTATALRLEWQSPAPTAPRPEDGWTSTPAGPSLPAATGAARLTLPNRTGWQRLTLIAPTDLTITGSWFERAMIR